MSTSKPRNIDYVWYIEPIDDVTNRVISERLVPDDARYHVLCADKRYRDMWRCNYDLVVKAIAQRSPRLKFKLFKELPGKTAILAHPFRRRRKKTMMKAKRRAR